MDTIILLLGCAFLIFLWHYGIKPILLEKYRLKLFAIRDRMFDDALSGKIDIESEDYREMRDFINRSIRFAHKLSLTGIWSAHILKKKFPDVFGKAIKDSPLRRAGAANPYYENIIEETIKLYFLYLLKKTPVLWVGVVILPPFLFLVWLKTWFSSDRRKIDKVSYHMDPIRFTTRNFERVQVQNMMQEDLDEEYHLQHV